MSCQNKKEIKSDLINTFLAFREQCIWLRRCYNIFTNLYDSSDEVSDILHSTAELFFQDFNQILIEYYYLLVSRITDPKGSPPRENLTIQNIDASLKSIKLFDESLKKLSENLLQYRCNVVEARNRLISHLDKTSILEQLNFGCHDKNEMIEFIKNLQKYCDQVGIILGKGPLDFGTQAGAGDELDLIRALERGLKVRETQ